MCADFVAWLNITEAIPYTLTIFPEGTRLTESKLRDSQDGEAIFGIDLEPWKMPFVSFDAICSLRSMIRFLPTDYWV